MYYFDYYPFWLGFFTALGHQVISSPPTHRNLLESGLKCASDDTCLPIKLLAGHLRSFKTVDAVFLPRLVSMEEKTYLCPKILGLPESLLDAMPTGIPLLSVTINWRKGKKEVLKALEELGNEKLGSNKRDIRRAFCEAQEWQKTYESWRRAGMSFSQSIELLEKRLLPATRPGVGLPLVKFKKNNAYSSILAQSLAHTESDALQSENKDFPAIALVGHSYLTYESYANLNLLQKLQNKAKVHLIESVSPEEVDNNLYVLAKKIFWSHARRIFGAGHAYIKDKTIDGIIYLSCFGCGTDSMIQDMLARKARQEHKPYMVLTLDEHSGEAGLVTRLEAFLDMLERRRGRESNISSHG